MWSYLRKKLGVREHEKKIYRNSKEIAEIKRRVSENKEKSDRRQVVKKVISRDHRVDQVQEEIRSLINWAKEVSEAVSDDKEAIKDLTYIIEDNIDVISDLNNMEDLREQNKALEEKIDRIESKMAELSENLSEFSSRNSQPVQRERRRTEGSDFSRDKRSDGIDETAKRIKEGRKLWKKATDAQRDIIKKMYDLGYPLTYRELSSELEKSVSTVKNQLNDLKSIGYEFDQDIGPNNAKKYLLDDRVKTFLTLRLND